MSCAGLSSLPEDILSDIYHRVAKRYLWQDDGLRRCCKLAGALPCFSSLSLPHAPLWQLTRKGLPWDGEQARFLSRAFQIVHTLRKLAEIVPSRIRRRYKVGIIAATLSVPRSHRRPG